MQKNMDNIDIQIFELLQNDGRMPNTDIAKRLKLSEAATRKRLKQLIDNEIIHVGAHLNYSKLGHAVEGNIKVKADMKKIDNIGEALCSIDSILYLAHLTGVADFDVDFSVKSQDDFLELIKTIHHIDGIISIEVSIRLKLLKVRYDLIDPSYSNGELPGLASQK